jgi:hypothetical protein
MFIIVVSLSIQNQLRKHPIVNGMFEGSCVVADEKIGKTYETRNYGFNISWGDLKHF